MNHFIKNIRITKLYQLAGINIPITDDRYPHLIITGKNGSGKTVLLNMIADALQIMKNRGTNKSTLGVLLANLSSDSVQIVKEYGDVTCVLDGYPKFEQEDFVTALYQADRSIKMIEPDSPQKPQVIINDIRKSSSEQFIKFLVDMKFQELLSISNQENEKANDIKIWFNDFENLLKEIFEDNNLTLSFNQDNRYTFIISKDGQKFGFNEMSDGFKAVLNIVADLILRMQNGNQVSKAYLKEGIVLIDEIETHLHLDLQKMVMPFLTKVFPNIQFIVTTHSPFVLSSMPNAVAYDLEHQKPVNNLAQYSYESLAEGYFGVTAISSDIQHRLNIIKELLDKEDLSVSEKATLRNYLKDFDNIPEAVSPSLIGEYLQTKLKHIAKIKELMQ
jgi:predicted ATPase